VVIPWPADPTNGGLTFGGWNTAANGTGTAFTASTGVTANITVYARWKDVTTIAAQSGPLTYGTGNSATFAVATDGISGAVLVSLSWFSELAGTTETAAPTGVTVTTAVAVGASPTNITVTTTTATPAGTFYFRAIIDGVTSTGVGTVTVAQKTLTNSDLEVTGSVTAKAYDGTATASGLTIGIKAASKVGGDTVGISGISYAFASADAGASVAITFSGSAALSGAASANYTLTGINLSTAPFAAVTGTINKAAGAAVSGAPAVSGIPTASSITVSAVTASSGTQAVEYAISVNSDGSSLSAWQDGTTFSSGLSAGTPYYVYARTQENGNYNAGAAQHSTAISTAAAGYNIADPTNPDLMTKFGVSTPGDAFTALHNLISAPETGDDFTAIIVLGDYIDLPSLTIDGTPITDTELTGHGRLLRLIVVGINSFQANGSYTGVPGAPSHVVFQFQNIPITRQMEATNTNANGYAGSAMRAWLTTSFLPGLKDATGLTDTVLWAPTRYVANKGNGANAADTITDSLWIPTEREMFLSRYYSSSTYETAENQAHLEYYPVMIPDTEADYTALAFFKKYNSSNNAQAYWEASPCSANWFAAVHADGYWSTSTSGNQVPGCAPAFCVR
jgi:uncharacterized repeat protein (TIGR02543 family)